MNIWVANKGSDSVTKLRANDGIVLGTYTVGIAPVSVCFDGLNIWVANSGSNSLSKL
jgi:DNA-binding beta-propeller fold protein YncE